MSKNRDEPETQQGVRQDGVQSLGRAFALLEEIANQEHGIGLANLAKVVGLHSSTTFHLVRTLVSFEYVRQDAETRRYHVGHKLFSTAASALTENALVSTASPYMEELARKTGESVYVAARYGDEIMVIAVVPGTGAVQLRGRPGSLRPPHATALGKCLVAALPPAQLSSLLDRVPLPALTPTTITDRTVLLTELERVHRSGIAFDDCEFDAEVRCVAVPVYNFIGTVTAAIAVSGPAWRMKLQVVGETVSHLRETALAISAALGYVVPGSKAAG